MPAFTAAKLDTLEMGTRAQELEQSSGRIKIWDFKFLSIYPFAGVKMPAFTAGKLDTLEMGTRAQELEQSSGRIKIWDFKFLSIYPFAGVKVSIFADHCKLC
ncbi:unnamed protein product [Fraxinus pennsylvanica]|uniref:Uncharacterized protein n=1 Tax=Fraxinus pennsylvanica TaxID=56036 RepID=A0AAD2DQJ7_9LAMI|nr:unnamed protein product [Fraxinus pennsylvanica]